MSFAQAEYAMKQQGKQQGKQKGARRERFLGEREEVGPWERLGEVIRPHDPAARSDGGARAASARDGAAAAHLFPATVVWAGQ